MKIPTIQEMLDYQNANPELSGLNVPAIYNAYEKSAGKNHKGEKVWTDSRGKIIGNWKLKMYTLAQYSPPKLCGICQKPASKYQTRNGVKFYLCPIHLPKETPVNPNPVLPTKNDEMVAQDKIQEAIRKLGVNMGR